MFISSHHHFSFFSLLFLSKVWFLFCPLAPLSLRIPWAGGRNGRNIAGIPGNPFAGNLEDGPFSGLRRGRANLAPGQGANPFATSDKKLEQYLLAHQGNTRYLVATTNAMSASPIILDTGKPVMALGGFSGSDSIVDTSKLSTMVANGTVRYFLLPSFNFGGFSPQIGGFGGGSTRAISSWVSTHCTAVPTNQWQTSSTTNPTGGFRGITQQTLYSCGNASS